MWIRIQDGALINTDALTMISVCEESYDKDKRFVKYSVYGFFANDASGDGYIAIASFANECDANGAVSVIFDDIAKGERTFDTRYLPELLDD